MNKKILAVICLAAVGITGCSKPAEKPAQQSAQPESLQKVMAPIAAVKSSEKYRKMFNETAAAMYGFQWIKDEQNPNNVDVEGGELYIPQALRFAFDLSPDSIILTQRLADAIANVEKAVQNQRKNAVKKTLSSQKEIHFWFDLNTLSEPNRKAAKYLIEAAYWVHELYKLQMDPNIAVTERKVYEGGDVDSIHLFERNAGAFCGRYGNKATCSVLPYYYEPDVGAIMWPDDMSQKVFDEIKANIKDPKTDPYLSPFTTVKRLVDGTLQVIPYGKFEPFKIFLEKIAALMEQAGDVEGIDKNFASQLKVQASAFRSEDPRPYFQSDEAWGKSSGELDLTVGPYETYEDPYGTKAFFEFALGAEDKTATDVVQKFMPLLPQIEQAFSLATGPDIYKARTISGVPPLRVVNVIIGTGEMKKAGGPGIAFSLPNIGPMAEEGRAKRVIFTNHHEAKYQILKAIAEIAIVPEQLQFVDRQSFVFDSTFHEIMHGIGPQRETKVTDSSNTALSIGEYYDSIEEAKANVGGIWSAKVLLDNNVITALQLKNIQTTYVAGLLRIMRFGAKEPHARGAALEFSYLFNKGGIEIKDGRFAVNYEKIQDSLNSLVSEIGKALAKGDKTAVKALLEDYPAKAPALLDEMISKFASAASFDGAIGIPRDVALVYHVIN